jgi:hypothetical protein
VNASAKDAENGGKNDICKCLESIFFIDDGAKVENILELCNFLCGNIVEKHLFPKKYHHCGIFSLSWTPVKKICVK